ncbi:hypothetical protein B0H66DRAFT_301421 [Apodospora peruviana]|uniref:Uncharacterized protein n=1 Tax=Apodospora peruviana TaxID=516989 RepID=A0AAE0I1E3_9PEZI|nr:hypothetical protein B0H66DRAFT_301421 [Apodospora peruviana]
MVGMDVSTLPSLTYLTCIYVCMSHKVTSWVLYFASNLFFLFLGMNPKTSGFTRPGHDHLDRTTSLLHRVGSSSIPSPAGTLASPEMRTTHSFHTRPACWLLGHYTWRKIELVLKQTSLSAGPLGCAIRGLSPGSHVYPSVFSGLPSSVSPRTSSRHGQRDSCPLAVCWAQFYNLHSIGRNRIARSARAPPTVPCSACSTRCAVASTPRTPRRERFSGVQWSCLTDFHASATCPRRILLNDLTLLHLGFLFASIRHLGGLYMWLCALQPDLIC